MTLQKQHLNLLAETLRQAFVKVGEGRPHLLLHGGAGPGSMLGLAAALSKRGAAIVPTHPGFDAEPRPEKFASLSDLTLGYLALIERLDLRGVVVVGNSLGGWLAAELALRQSPRIAGAVLLNSVGVDSGSPEITIADPSKLTPQQLGELAFHDIKKRPVPASAEAAAQLIENQRALRIYSGELFMYDPTLRARLANMAVPTLVGWGESDRVVDVRYGRSLAAAIPGARFEIIKEAGHLPQIEQVDATSDLIEDFTRGLR